MINDRMRLMEKLNKETEMYAIVEIAGQQFKVEEGKKIFVHRLETRKTRFLNSTKSFSLRIMKKSLSGNQLC